MNNFFKHILSAVSIAGLVAGTVSCDKDNEQGIYPVAPTAIVESVAPLAGFAGQEVTIKGSGFGETRSTHVGRVYFGDIEASTYKSWSENEIVVKVPANGNGDVVVWIERNVTKSGKNFECYEGAVMTGYTPMNGVNKGEVLTIEGRNFKRFIDLGVKAADVNMTFLGSMGKVVTSAKTFTENMIEFEIPEEAAGGATEIDFGGFMTIDGPTITIIGELILVETGGNCKAPNGSNAIGGTQNGGWAIFTFKAPDTGKFVMAANAATGSNGRQLNVEISESIDHLMNDEPAESNYQNVPNNGWKNPTRLEYGPYDLTRGKTYYVKFYFRCPSGWCIDVFTIDLEKV
ncbi:MAG: IPT/TIG domain-containing protein [Muribaculaceae bacterium]|nr:IPT/TIG domain-containing protein [Muribaculaceae bacterium]